MITPSLHPRSEFKSFSRGVLNSPRSNFLAFHPHTAPNSLVILGHHLVGVSVAAVETCICIPSLSLCFDIGKSPSYALPMRHVALTHGHCDHVHGLPLHIATRALQKLPPATYYTPPAIASDLSNLVAAVGKLEQSELRFQPTVLQPGAPAVKLKRGWELRSVYTQHSVPSQGYVVDRVYRKLKKEYRGMETQDIISMKKNGIVVDEEQRTAEIVFTGDTTWVGVEKVIDAVGGKLKVLVTECTFLQGEVSRQKAKRLGHVHIEDIMNAEEVLAGVDRFVLTHFSSRYGQQEIKDAVKLLPEVLRNKCHPFGIGPHRE